MGRRKKLETIAPPEPTSIRISKKITLNPGDDVRVTQGPYYVCKDGKKINMGHTGKGVYLRSHDEENILVRFPSQSRSEIIYIGPEYISDLTGMVMRPHKIAKVRKK